MPSVTNMLKIDSAAGLTWGILVMAFHGHIAAWLGLPVKLVLFQGTANLVYCLYSGTLALRRERSDFQLKFLVYANLFYGVLCLGFLGLFFGAATWLGRVSLFLEFVILASLAAFEHRVFFGAQTKS